MHMHALPSFLSQGMFRDAAAFNGVVSEWDVVNVTEVEFMFNGTKVDTKSVSWLPWTRNHFDTKRVAWLRM